MSTAPSTKQVYTKVGSYKTTRRICKLANLALAFAGWDFPKIKQNQVNVYQHSILEGYYVLRIADLSVAVWGNPNSPKWKRAIVVHENQPFECGDTIRPPSVETRIVSLAELGTGFADPLDPRAFYRPESGRTDFAPNQVAYPTLFTMQRCGLCGKMAYRVFLCDAQGRGESWCREGV